MKVIIENCNEELLCCRTNFIPSEKVERKSKTEKMRQRSNVSGLDKEQSVSRRKGGEEMGRWEMRRVDRSDESYRMENEKRRDGAENEDGYERDGNRTQERAMTRIESCSKKMRSTQSVDRSRSRAAISEGDLRHKIINRDERCQSRDISNTDLRHKIKKHPGNLSRERSWSRGRSVVGLGSLQTRESSSHGKYSWRKTYSVEQRSTKYRKMEEEKKEDQLPLNHSSQCFNLPEAVPATVPESSAESFLKVAKRKVEEEMVGAETAEALPKMKGENNEAKDDEGKEEGIIMVKVGVKHG